MGAAPTRRVVRRAVVSRPLVSCLVVGGIAVAAVAAVCCAAAGTASARTVWLCKPGQTPDPCNVGLATTVFTPTLHKLRVIHPVRVKHPAIDCFYVYPTVSDQKTTLANLHVDPEERSIALYQAARYGQYCRVFAPMYRQVTIPALTSGNRESPQELAVPIADVRAAFATYLHRYNHGHGFVLIGHSQGSLVLEQLIAKDIDAKPSVRKRLVSAILLGGNVLVRRGKKVGGSFKHIPACRTATQLGCVIAFSTFDQPPPTDAIFGRTAVAGEQVLCSNPAALGGGAATVDPVFPSAPFAPNTLIAAGIALLRLTQPTAGTPWTSEPGAYRARCSSAGGANVLLVTARHGAQTATPSPDPSWGLHLVDANIALGNLLTDVRSEAAAFAARPSAPLAPPAH